jgi:threonine/homoserine/homoserine lactone efflux protein
MLAASPTLPLAALGFALGWSVAWPPGPINAEIIRRGLARGFWSGYSVGLGAATGDGVWAIAAVLGASALLGWRQAGLLLAALSTAVLLLLAAVYLRGAWHGLRQWRARIAPPPQASDGARTGYLLGLGLAVSSPWNVAFWLAVVGRPETLSAGPAGAPVIALAVLAGTNLWVLLLCGAVALLRWRFATGAWEALAKGATGLLMLAFAVDGLRRLASGTP